MGLFNKVMKHLKKRLAAGSIYFLLIGITLSLTFCTKKDQVLDLNPPPSGPNDTLFSLKVTSGPAFVSGLGINWNGSIDPIWEKATKMKEHLVVPNLGNNTFTGFIGNATDVTLRSLYDANNIYVLAEWNCSQKNAALFPWYFDPVTHLWAQESDGPVYDENGIQIRAPFIQDQFAIMFNVANSCFDFRSKTCYAACHVCTPETYLDPVTGKIITVPVYGGVMHTNGPGEKLDLWWAKATQVLNSNQANDCYQDWGNGAINETEIHDDAETAPFAGETNIQSLKLNGTGALVDVPVWVKLNGSYSNGAILAPDTVNCKYIIKVDSSGLLHYADARGGNETGTIDPNTDTGYQQAGEGDGSRCIPGMLTALYTGSRADISANAYWTGTGWRLMLKRALKTNDVSAQDVDLSSLSDQLFGIAVMFDGADNEHAIKPDLMLRFQK